MLYPLFLRKQRGTSVSSGCLRTLESPTAVTAKKWAAGNASLKTSLLYFIASKNREKYREGGQEGLSAYMNRKFVSIALDV